METLSLLAASAAGLIVGGGATAWLVRRRPVPMPTAPAADADPAVVAPGPGAEEVVLRLDQDGRLASFEGPLEALLGPDAPAGGGRGLARLRLQALRLRAESPPAAGSPSGAATVRGEPIEGAGGPLVPEIEVQAEGFRVALRPAPQPLRAALWPLSPRAAIRRTPCLAIR